MSQLILSRKQALRQKGYTLRVDLSRQEKANKASIQSHPAFAATVAQILQEPKGRDNNIYWDLDTATTVLKGVRTFWSAERLALLASQQAPAAAVGAQAAGTAAPAAVAAAAATTAAAPAAAAAAPAAGAAAAAAAGSQAEAPTAQA